MSNSGKTKVTIKVRDGINNWLDNHGCSSVSEIMAQWKFSGDKHKSLQVDTERTFHQRYPLVML